MEAYLEAMDDYGFFAFMALDDGPLTSEVTERFDTVIKSLIHQYPEKLDYRIRRIAMLGLRGENFGWLNEFDEGRKTLTQALDVAKEASDKFGSNPDIQARLAKIYKAYSELEHKAGLQDLGEQELAVDYANEGIALLQGIENDDSLSQKRNNEETLFYLYYSKTVSYQALPDYQKSADTANQALKLINRLIDLNPDNFSYKRNKYYLENALAQTYAVLGNNQQAQNMFYTAIASVSEALRGDADSPMILTDYGTILGESATALELIGNHVKACDLANKSLAAFEKLTERQQINAYHQEVIIPKIKTTQIEVCK
jgi:tetratricopeptide (TPR) repeat protein